MPVQRREFHATDGLTFTLATELRAGTLHAEVAGAQDSLAVSIGFWRELAAEAARTHAQRLLVVDRLQGEPLDPDGMEQLVGSLVGIGLETRRIAYVEPTAEHLPAMEHGEIFAAELGFTARVFGDVGHADRWLRYGAA